MRPSKATGYGFESKSRNGATFCTRSLTSRTNRMRESCWIESEISGLMSWNRSANAARRRYEPIPTPVSPVKRASGWKPISCFFVFTIE